MCICQRKILKHKMLIDLMHFLKRFQDLQKQLLVQSLKILFDFIQSNRSLISTCCEANNSLVTKIKAIIFESYNNNQLKIRNFSLLFRNG